MSGQRTRRDKGGRRSERASQEGQREAGKPGKRARVAQGERGSGKRARSDASERSVAGRRVAEEAIRAGTAKALLVDAQQTRALASIVESARAHAIPVREVPREELDARVSEAMHQGVIALCAPFAYASVESLMEAPLLVALDEITDPHNLGAILRSAFIFGAGGALIPEHRAAGVTPVVTRTSAGATEHLPIAQVTNLQRTLLDLHHAGFEIIGLDAGGTLSSRELGAAAEGKRVLVVGAEGKGLRRMVRERCDQICSIPQRGMLDSLNASVAAGIVLYELSQQMNKRTPEKTEREADEEM